MTAYVQVVTTYPDGTTRTDVHLNSHVDLARMIAIYRHVMPHGDDVWTGDTLSRVRCIHGPHRGACRPVVELITFHATDPRLETAA